LGGGEDLTLNPSPQERDLSKMRIKWSRKKGISEMGA
jgi:hypothetical protein